MPTRRHSLSPPAATGCPHPTAEVANSAAKAAHPTAKAAHLRWRDDSGASESPRGLEPSGPPPLPAPPPPASEPRKLKSPNRRRKLSAVAARQGVGIREGHDKSNARVGKGVVPPRRRWLSTLSDMCNCIRHYRIFVPDCTAMPRRCLPGRKLSARQRRARCAGGRCGRGHGARVNKGEGRAGRLKGCSGQEDQAGLPASPPPPHASPPSPSASLSSALHGF